MNILHVTPTYLPATRYGGPIYSVHALCRSLTEAGHRVDVFTTDVDGPSRSPVPLETAVDYNGVSVTYFPTGVGRRLYRSPAMARALAQRVPHVDIVHLHSVFLWPTAAAASIARAHGVPYVLSPRGMLVGDLIRRKSRVLKSVWIALLERRNLAGAAAIHATSDIEVDEIMALGLAARRYAVIPNGMDLPDANHRPATAGRDPLTILFLGRLNWKKGLDLLIPALASVPGTRLVVAGNDEENYLPQLIALAAEHGVTDRVAFVGAVHGEVKERLLQTADIFALTSYSENFGNAVLEAMAYAIPVVVTPGVGLANVVADHGAGLVAQADPAAIAQVLRRLSGDEGLRRRCGDAGRWVVADHFSWGKIAGDMIDLYRLVAGEPALPYSPFDAPSSAASVRPGQ